jgi:hypothetical protein
METLTAQRPFHGHAAWGLKDPRAFFLHPSDKVDIDVEAKGS